MEFSDVYYLPSYVKSSIKKHHASSALVMIFHKNIVFPSEQFKLVSSNKFDIKLKTNLPKKIYEDNEKGLTQDVLNSMKLDDRFIWIVAFDTFFCNFDRHNENILYNINNKNIISIDQGGSYQMSILSLDIVDSLKSNNFFCKNNHVINKYYTYLKEIHSLVSKKELIDAFYYLFQFYILYYFK